MNIEEAKSTSLEIYVNKLDDQWYERIWEKEAGSLEVTDAANKDGVEGAARQVNFDGMAAFFFQSYPRDMLHFLSAGAELRFDIKVLSDPVDSSNVIIRVDCDHPYYSGIDITKDLPPVGEWKEMRYPLMRFKKAGTEFTKVNTPFLIANKKKLKVVISNVRWEVPADNLFVPASALAHDALENRPETKYPRDKSKWKQIWSDEFDYEGPLDHNKWSHDIEGPGWVNNERQNYTNRLENSRVEDGHLIIEARKDNFDGHEYSSARVHTRHKGDWLYGRVEVKAKLPTGRGTWAAIWMMPTNFFEYGNGWPDSGELDVMEHVGGNHGSIHASTHTNKYYWVYGNQKSGAIYNEDVCDEYHVYAVEWYPDRIDVYMDDELYFSNFNENSGWEAWPFDKPFYLILNIAIGGSWGGQLGIDDSIFDSQVAMIVDYVRVYDMGLEENVIEKSGDPSDQ